MTLIALLAILLLAPAPAPSAGAVASASPTPAVFDAALMKAWCAEPTSDNAHRAACFYYVRGIEDGMQFSRTGQRSGLSFCPPDGLTIEGSVNAVVAQLSDPRVNLAGPASTGVITALAKSYPCDPQSSTPKPAAR